MSSPLAKRQRVEENIPITRSNIWHSDGSVVLQADATQFRIHFGLLALHSPFFRDMQALPQPANQPGVEGCPVVELSDAVVDVEYLLTALYTPTFLAQTVLSLPAIGALIRLGRKYDFCDLLKSAVGRLTFEYPASLEEYDSSLASDDYTYTPTRIVSYRGIHFDIISLARENSILSVLPSAYYRSIVDGLDDVLNGIPRDDGTLASLATVDQHRCIRGREKLLNVQLQPGYSIGWYRSWKPGNDCTGGQCTKLINDRLRRHLNQPSMKALAKFQLNNSYNKNWCVACKRNIHELSVAARQKMWNELPIFFDLPPWNELKNDL